MDVANPVRMWCRMLGEGTDGAAVLAGLRRCGIDIEQGASSVDAPGVLVCTNADPAQLARITECTSAGARAIAVATKRCAAADTLWPMMAAGASDVVEWDEAIAPAVAARLRRWADVEGLIRSAAVRDQLVGDAAGWRRVLRDLVEAARYSTANVLLLGESGTGKEQAARAVHALDARRQDGPFVVLDCSTLVAELAGSEFFGHERGAFTGAATRRDGAFSLAHGGTLFLDEIGELPLIAQAQLLRVVQEGTFKRVGGNDWLGTDFRLVAATNRDLREDVDSGRFRRDLYYRIAGWVCRLPPLRERRADLLTLARHFAATGSDGDVNPFTPAVEQFLLQREYPGNVRDLRQLVQQMRHRHAGPDPITIGDIPESERPTRCEVVDVSADALERWVAAAVRSGLGLKEIGRRVEAAAIRSVHARVGNYRDVADVLGVSVRTVHGRMAEAQRDSSDQAS